MDPDPQPADAFARTVALEIPTDYRFHQQHTVMLRAYPDRC